MADFKRCPFCQSCNLYCRPDCTRIVCPDCGTEGPLYRPGTPSPSTALCWESARDRWNTRFPESPEADRKGDWMETYSGAKVWPTDIRPGDVRPIDVAHSLGNICRYGGHCRERYSVAQHCCLLSDYALQEPRDPQLALDLLVHDAAEAYLGDIPRPLKRSMPAEWKLIEDAADRVCITELGGRYPLLPEVKRLDNAILVDERRALMKVTENEWLDTERVEGLGFAIEPWSPKEARAGWLRRYFALLQEVVYGV